MFDKDENANTSLQTAVSAGNRVPGALGLIVSLNMPKDGHLLSSFR